MSLGETLATIGDRPLFNAAFFAHHRLCQFLLEQGFDANAAEPDTGEEALAEFGGAVQAIAAEARLLAHPVSFEVVSSGKAEGIEDRTTMAPLAARRLADMADLAARVISLELLVAAQAIDLRRPARLGEGTGRALRLVRELAGFTARGQAPPADLEPLVDAVRAGSFARAALPGQ